MAHFLRHRERVTVSHFSYDVTDEFGSGWTFQTTPDRDVVLDWENADIQAASWLAALAAVKAGTHKGVYQQWDSTYTEPAAIACNRCNAEVVLDDNLYNECQCGVGYNASGQQLAPVSQWERQDVYDTFGPRNDPDQWWD